MYLPAHFEETRPEVLQELLSAHPLGLLVTQDQAGGLAANSLPFLLAPDPAGGPGILRGHVARANPLWRESRTDVDVLVVFQGPQAYISPSMYPSKAATGKVVPTWNYSMVQARGPLRAIDDADWLHAFVTRLTERHEAQRPVPWEVSDAPGDYINAMLRAIVGIEIRLTSLRGKLKLSQNRTRPDQEGVVYGLRSQGGAEAEAMAQAVEQASLLPNK
nr:FMN-binding negative transcriptional regulator [uncultured Albidiferax sp.]